MTERQQLPRGAEDLHRVTITDVARAAGVSVATVSKVINERYGVAARTSEHVQRVIEQLGYESSLVARSLRSHRTHVIGILVPEFEPFSTEVLKGTSRAITGTGYELLAYSGGGRAGEVVGWERRYLSRLSGTLIDGAIMMTPTVVRTAGSVPVVAIDPHAGPADSPTVDADSYAGAVMATEHLLQLGHRRIGFLGGRPDLDSARLREDGYRDALASAGIPVDPDLVRLGGYRRQVATAPTRELLSLADRPTAIFAANDLSAIGVLDVAYELGLSVPADLSVVGFDNVPESALTEPPLTTVQQPLQEMGAQAVHLLLRLVHGEPGASTHVRLPTSLVRRGSTAPPSTTSVARR
ncbi:LacI family DNA-binding transcriptional regulator [Cellulomonas sp. NS3]|uniref:LacI family DNA-binding transcriptional regulator n=1 Tax=Cellulomonas sp. NS3 TaxID=2973977 RepID=UPI0021615B4A|nr:LacI family DNA-binding transcriptional regulator [Cellulomonas sp. NS3]